MKRTMLAALSCLALAAMPLAAAPAPAPAAPPIQYTSRTLANGLRVFAIPDRASPNVSVQVWYDVGSKDDPAGRSGFAHLFEHLMFKATRNMVPEQFDRLTEDVGGYNNASTNDDFTNYYEVVPANHLQRLLWAEAERMGSLVVDPAQFKSERDVVKEELRSRVLAQPYGKLFYLYLPQVSYSVHPYARPGIGSIADLDSATIRDVRAFHATYYRPDNAVLVVSGGFDQAELDAWVDLYFAPIARPSAAIPRVKVAEPRRTAPRRFTVHEPNTPLPAVLLSYPAPPAASDDAAVLEVAGAILSSGASSRLYEGLVRTRIATDADSGADLKQDRGIFYAYAILASGQTAAAGETALRREFARLRDTPVTAVELAEARNELLTAALKERETVEGKASAIAEAVIVRGSPQAAERRIAQIAATTPADIQRAARKWLTDAQSASVRYLPEAKSGAKPVGDRIATATTVRTAALTPPAHIAIVTPASDQERIAPPPPSAEAAPALPAPVTRRLANGLTLVTVPRRSVPLVSATLVSTAGAALDPAGKAGLAGLTAELLAKGTTTRSATQIAQAIEALGGTLDTGADYDGVSASLTVKSDQLDPALAILADVARNPVFANEEIERQRGITLDEVSVAMQDPGPLSRIVAGRALFGPGGYGGPLAGTPTSLKAIARDDILAAYRRAFAPAAATLVLAGDIDPASAAALAERYFGDWAAPAPAAALAPAAPPASGRVIVIDMPGAGQAAVAMVRPGIARGDPRYYPAIVANSVFGGGYSARLNQEIRIKRGLSYGAGSALDARRYPGPLTASVQTKNESAAEVLGLILGEMRRLGAEPIPAAELAARKAVLTGSFGRRLETTAGLAGIVADYILDGVSTDELARFQQSVAAVTPGQARAAAGSIFAPAGATVVIVGDSRKFLDALRRDAREVTVIPLAKLDLETLPKP